MQCPQYIVHRDFNIPKKCLLCVEVNCGYYFVALYSESVLSDLQVDLDDHGAIVPPHLAKGLEAE